jgi:hypothetical protein
MSNHSESKGLRLGGVAIIAGAIGAVAVGAFAIGALAVGRLAIGRFVVGKARFKSLEVDDLTVTHFHVAVLEQSVQPELSTGETEDAGAS